MIVVSLLLLLCLSYGSTWPSLSIQKRTWPTTRNFTPTTISTFITNHLSSIPIILYVSSPESSNNQTRFSQNCTLSEPCKTISEAFVRLDSLFRHHEIPTQSEAIFKLMNGGNYSSSCQMFSYSLHHYSFVTIEPMEISNDTTEIFFDCQTKSFFSFFRAVHVTVKSITIRNALLSETVSLETVTFENCKLYNILYSENAQVNRIDTLKFHHSRIDGLHLDAIYNLEIDSSNVTNSVIYSSTTFPGNPGANVTIINSHLQNVNYHSFTDVDGVDYNELFLMKNSVCENSVFQIKRFKSVLFELVDFQDNNYMFQYFSFVVTLMTCQSNGIFNMQFEGIDKLIIENSNFYNSHPFQSPYEALLEITNGYRTFMATCRFENISQPALVVKGVAVFTTAMVDFSNIDGGALLIDSSTLSTSTISIGPSSFTNISNLNGNGGGICVLNGDYVKVEATFKWNRSLNGAGAYIEANAPVVDVVCHQNHALQNAGCVYIKPLKIYGTIEGSGIVATNNTALRGGAVFFDSPMDDYTTISIINCYNNFASYSGMYLLIDNTSSSHTFDTCDAID